MDIAQILTRRYEGAEWTLNGDEYAGLTWIGPGKKPSKTALENLWAEVETEIAAEAQAKLDAKASAVAKLEAMGLTVDEIREAFGIEAL